MFGNKLLFKGLNLSKQIPHSIVSICQQLIKDSLALAKISHQHLVFNKRNRSVFEGTILHCVDRGKYDEPEWQTSSILETQNKSDPHRACLLCDGAVSDDRLRRSEVCCAASLMAARLQKAKRTGDRIVPVGYLRHD
jgi:predicted nucleic acid-binding Zn ribbon protein